MSAQFDEWDVTDTPFVGSVQSVRVREYSSPDYEGVRNLYFGTYKELAMNNQSIRSYIHKSFKNSFDKVSHLIKKPERNKLWVALNADGCVVGMAGLRVSSSSSYEIQKLAVAKNYRCLGISNLLWKELEREGCLLCPDRPLQIRLSTISLLSIAESYYVKKGFSLLSHLHLNGYDLDVFEKTVRN